MVPGCIAQIKNQRNEHINSGISVTERNIKSHDPSGIQDLFPFQLCPEHTYNGEDKKQVLDDLKILYKIAIQEL